MRPMPVLIPLLFAVACATTALPVADVALPDWIEELPPQARTVVSEGYPHVYACSVESGDSPKGELSIMLGTQNGRVKTWAVLVNDSGQQALAECALRKARTWRFPKGFNDDLTLSFEFGTGE